MIAELEFIKYVVLGSDGDVEVSRPATDDDRRDADVHRRGDFVRDLGFQIKSAAEVEHPWATDRLHVRFTVLKDRLITHPNFWYFLAYLDCRRMRLADPVFIIPSAEVHEHAIPHLHGDTWHFDFHASLGPNAHDRWEPYRANTLDIGKRILSIIQDLETGTASSSPLLREGSMADSSTYSAGVIWVRKREIALPEAV